MPEAEKIKKFYIIFCDLILFKNKKGRQTNRKKQLIP